MKDLFEHTIHNHFWKELPAEPVKNAVSRVVYKVCFSYLSPAKSSDPQLVHLLEKDVIDLVNISNRWNGKKSSGAYMPPFHFS